MSSQANVLRKTATGIDGFDEITFGGLPTGRPTLICGTAGCGKTLFALEFLIRGALEYEEPGVFMAFEETQDDLIKNVASLGFDLGQLVADKKVKIDHVQVDRSQIEEIGDYDLEALFIRLDLAIKSIGAKRVVLDTIETLFSGFSNPAILRSELNRLFLWLKERGVTAVITGERGNGQLTRQGLEEYISDCVILLDHRVTEQVSTRRLRIVKYRGSLHGTNEYPFMIDDHGISVIPITSGGLQHITSNERISTGVEGLDYMLGGKGVFRGSSILLSGTSGTGKSNLAAHFAEASCARNEACVYFSFEESPSQILRNVRSIGLDLKKHLDAGILKIISTRPTHFGLEMHLGAMLRILNEFKPKLVIIDPITTFTNAGSKDDANGMVLRLVDHLKSHNITALYNSLTGTGGALEVSEAAISSLMDTWLLLRDIEVSGERNRGIYVLKSRGMDHSNQIREFIITSDGIQLREAYLGAGRVLTGSARVAQEILERQEVERVAQVRVAKKLIIEGKRKTLAMQIEALQADLEAEEYQLQLLDREIEQGLASVRNSQDEMGLSRGYRKKPSESEVL